MVEYAQNWVKSSAVHKLGVMGYYYNPSTQGMEAEESEVQGHPQLHNKFKANLGYMRIFLLKYYEELEVI